ncbi:hypothetical protein ATN01_00845 [Buchnera aphidicola (Diuraphis noxia)]|uniref:CvpA family protein n=1 Tax=Buchnera aphidicola subsp. Diuraphis noxia TaxID=118101 RepID=A0A1B2H8P9_BUCDN|nr:hypothetical protein ATN01_00845 [Buchnera aphidicola (Diuraphis noxia)]
MTFVVLFCFKQLFNYCLTKIIKNNHLSFLNFFLGGLFGIFRGVILVCCVLFCFKYMNLDNFEDYVKYSIFISFFSKIFIYLFDFFNRV